MEIIHYLYFVISLYIFFRKVIYDQIKKKLAPSPVALPIIGHFYLFKNNLAETIDSLSSRYGPLFALRFGCRSFLVVSSPSLVKECFTKNDMCFAKRPKFLASDHFTFNYSLFVWAPYGHHWKTLRRLIVVELLGTSSLQTSAKIREEEMQTLLRVVVKASKEGSRKVDLDYLVSVYIYNVIMRLVAGKCYVKENDAATETAKNNVAKFRSIFGASISMTICDFFPVLRFVGYKELEKNMISMQKKKNDFIQETIDQFKQQIITCSAFKKGVDKRPLVETLLSLQESDPDFYKDDLIKSLILIMFVAGTAPASKTIKWAMRLLLTHPKELHKLKTEIENVVGFERLMNESDLAKLPYLHCVVKETLRMYPPLPILMPHHSSEDCVVGGYDIPKDTILLVNVKSMHRDDKVWTKPNEFMPERFLGMEVETEGFKFVPFGKGRRSCPGENMGLRTILLALGGMIQGFDWKVDQDNNGHHMKISNVLTEIGMPLEFVCIPRQLKFVS